MRGDTDLDNDQKLSAAVVSLFLVGVMSALLIDAFGSKEIKISGAKGAELVNTGKAASVANVMFSSYVVPFELVSVLLLAALVGAVVIARRD